MALYTKENCLHRCLITVCPFFTLCHCRYCYALDLFLQLVYRKLWVLGAWPWEIVSMHKVFLEESSVYSTVTCPTYAFLSLPMQQEKSFTDQRNLLPSFISCATICVKIKYCLGEDSTGKATKGLSVQYLTSAVDNASIHWLIIFVYIAIYYTIWQKIIMAFPGSS